MQNSARCVFPVRSVSMLRRMRSTNHGGSPLSGSSLKAISSSNKRSSRPSSTRGAWLVGPRNSPENR